SPWRQARSPGFEKIEAVRNCKGAPAVQSTSVLDAVVNVGARALEARLFTANATYLQLAHGQRYHRAEAEGNSANREPALLSLPDKHSYLRVRLPKSPPAGSLQRPSDLQCAWRWSAAVL